jgi:hemerythrin
MTHYPTPLLPLEQIPEVALESMNQTHREEVELVNRLAALVASGMEGAADTAAISAHLDDWVGHTRQHFSRENALMQQHDFPAYSVHSGEHERVLAQLEALQTDWLERNNLPPLASFLFEQWHAWFDNHVHTMDNITASFIRQQGG